MRTDASVTQLGLDIHRKFSKVTARSSGPSSKRPTERFAKAAASAPSTIAARNAAAAHGSPACRPSKDSSRRRCESAVGESNVSPGVGPAALRRGSGACRWPAWMDSWADRARSSPVRCMDEHEHCVRLNTFFIPLRRAPGEGARNVCSSLGETTAPATQKRGKQARDREMPFMDRIGPPWPR